MMTCSMSDGRGGRKILTVSLRSSNLSEVPERKKKGRKGGPRDPSAQYRALIALATIPLFLGVAPLVGWWLGRWVDRRAGTDWVFQGIGILLGFVAGVKETIDLVRRAQKELDR
jgi:hypothetical protein